MPNYGAPPAETNIEMLRIVGSFKSVSVVKVFLVVISARNT